MSRSAAQRLTHRSTCCHLAVDYLTYCAFVVESLRVRNHWGTMRAVRGPPTRTIEGSRSQPLPATVRHRSLLKSCSCTARIPQCEASTSGRAADSATDRAASGGRRRACVAMLGAAAAALAPRPQPSLAALVDEEAATSVFASASGSVVSVIDYRVQGTAEVFEGVGSGEWFGTVALLLRHSAPCACVCTLVS